MDLDAKLENLRQEYRRGPSKILELRGKLLKWALEKRQQENGEIEKVKTIFLR